MAGTINYLAPVDNASGKIFGKKQKFVAVTRKKGNRIRGCAVTGVRTTKPTALELQHRIKFAAVRTATLARKEDPTKVAADQANYAKVKDQYNSLYHYIFRQEWEAYEEQ